MYLILSVCLSVCLSIHDLSSLHPRPHPHFPSLSHNERPVSTTVAPKGASSLNPCSPCLPCLRCPDLAHRCGSRESPNRTQVLPTYTLQTVLRLPSLRRKSYTPRAWRDVTTPHGMVTRLEAEAREEGWERKGCGHGVWGYGLWIKLG